MDWAEPWPWWLGALGLAACALSYLVWMRRPLGVSGVLATALSSTARKTEAELAAVDEAALERALMEATRAQFGEAAVAEPEPPPAQPQSARAGPPLTWSQSLLFLVGIVLGGTLWAVVTQPTVAVELVPTGLFATLFGEQLQWAALFFGGALVGVGTAMAGGCTSGHGLVGCGRLQIPSLIATACFFGTGIAIAFAVKHLVLP